MAGAKWRCGRSSWMSVGPPNVDKEIVMSKFKAQACCLLAFTVAFGSALAKKDVMIVSEAKAGKYWTPADTSAVAVSAATAAAIGESCVSVGYYLGEDGIPSQFAALKAWTVPRSEAGKAREQLELLQKLAVASLQQRRFIPAKGGQPRPIYTSATFVFTGQSSVEAELRKHCVISDLNRFIAEAQRDADPISWHQIWWNGEWFKAKTRAHGLNRE
jgi:hypothetical protein